MWKKQCKSQNYDASFSIPEICLPSRIRWQISTNLKIKLWNAKLRNCDIMNASNLPQLRPRSQDTSGWEMTIIFEKNLDIFFHWCSGSWSNFSSYQRAAGGGRGGGGEVGPPLLWGSCCHSCPQAWGRHSGWVRSQLDIIGFVLALCCSVVGRLTQLFYIWIFIC